MPAILAAIFACLLAIYDNAALAQQLVHGELLFVAPDIYSPHRDQQFTPNRQQADQFYEQSRAACEQGDIGKALRLATRAVREDPNHADARRVLGYGGSVAIGREATRLGGSSAVKPGIMSSAGFAPKICRAGKRESARKENAG